MTAETPNLRMAECPLCHGSGWELVEGRGVRPCSCKSQSRGDVLLAQARVPRHFAHCSLHNFQPTNYLSVFQALASTKDYVDQYPLVDVGMLFLGRCGVGKTHLAVAALKEMIRKGASGLFYDFRDLLKEIQDSYNPRTNTSELKILAPVFEADVLVLDELGAGRPTEWVQETITHIITKRYNDGKVTIFTTNYQDYALAGSPYSETLTDRIGIRLRSRLREMCRLVLIEGEDYRERIRDRRGSRFV